MKSYFWTCFNFLKYFLTFTVACSGHFRDREMLHCCSHIDVEAVVTEKQFCQLLCP